jgi:hypothetical protein
MRQDLTTDKIILTVIAQKGKDAMLSSLVKEQKELVGLVR